MSFFVLLGFYIAVKYIKHHGKLTMSSLGYYAILLYITYVNAITNRYFFFL